MNPDVFICELLQYMVLFPAAALCFLPMRHQLKLTPLRTFAIVTGVLLVLVPLASCFATVMGLSTNALLLPMLFGFFLCYYHMVQSGPGETLAIFLQVVALLSFPSDYALAFDAKLNPTGTLAESSIACSAFQLTMSLGFALLFGALMYRFESSLIDRLPHARLWYATLPMPLAFLVLNILIQPINYSTLYTGRIFFLYIFLLCMSLFLFILTYIIFYFVAEELLTAAKNKEHMQLLKMQEHQYLAQQTYIDESKRIRHDFRQSLFTLARLAEDGEFETIHRYLKTYVEALPQNETLTYCNNLSVNALLNYYADLMTEHNIDMKWEISLPDDCSIPDIDLCGMLGNLLENILHACCTVSDQDRFCYLSILPKHNTSLYIVASNNFGNTLRTKGDTYGSTSKGGHGIGLSSIAATAERYGGMARFTHTGNEFHSDIVLHK